MTPTLRARVPVLSVTIIAATIIAAAPAQGPGSCGFHLDLITNDTSTHSAIADMPGSPGAAPFGIATGAVGNPYAAWATPGTQVSVRLAIPAGVLGSLGSGGIISILAAVGAPNLALTAPPDSIPPCGTSKWIVSVLPIGGALADGLGLFGPPPVFLPSDPGYPSTFQLTVTYPPGVPTVTLQAVVLLPGGQLAVSNGVSLHPGPSPHQTPLAFSHSFWCPASATDEGFAVVAMPVGFEFYGVPTNAGFVRPNGLVEFGPAAGVACNDTSGFGCVTGGFDVSPRVAVNLFDADLAVALPGDTISDVTVEYAPPTSTTPWRTIVRWKHTAPRVLGGFPGPGPLDAEHATSACEFWGSDVPGAPPVATRIVVVRQDFHVGLLGFVHGGLGIDPGSAGQGYGGPPPLCHAIGFWGYWGEGSYFDAGPLESMYLSSPFSMTGSLLLSSLATVFTPLEGGAYRVKTY